MINVNLIASNITFNPQGFWETQVRKKVSYTKNGHNTIKESEQKSFWFSHRKNCIVNAIDNKLNGPILDVGGGNGVFTKYFQNKNLDTLLIEPGVAGVQNAVKNGVENIINGSLLDVKLADTSFSAVVLLDVLEHIENDEAFLSELNRILKEQGQLVLTVPAFPFLFSDFDKEVGHFRRYTLARLQEKLQKSGFSIQYKTYFFSLLPLPILIGRFIINKFKKQKNRKSTGHINRDGLLGKIIQKILSPELLLIKQKITIPFGSSCLIVARKIKN